MSYESNKPAIVGKLQQANAAGVLAAGLVVEEAVKAGLEGGFTSGDFDTGESVRGVQHTEPAPTTDGVAVRVGTDIQMNLYWEIGGYNAYTRKFERKEVWMPALVSTRPQQIDAFTRAHREVLQ